MRRDRSPDQGNTIFQNGGEVSDETTNEHRRRRHARGTHRQDTRRDLETLRSVGHLVAAAWRMYGGRGRVTAIRLRGHLTNTQGDQ